ncbi:MAG: HugZ family protein [Xanthobacteraceae bacterium]
MVSDTDFDAAGVARGLLRTSRQGALATLMVGSGDPYCSLVNVASAPDGSPLLLISRLAVHTRNALADPRVSLMLDERRAGDPLEGARIMVGGIAEPVRGEPPEAVRRRYLAAHPGAQEFVGFSDFLFVAIRIKAVHLVAGFGRIVDLAADQVVSDLAGAEALLAAEADIVAHLNADHRDTMNLYATRLLGGDAGTWSCVGCDPDGMDLQLKTAALRLDFPNRVVTPGALRLTLKQIADGLRAD